jgi:carbonic anhydrase/acetyltransferase-like protein (isoleucine patch superfamily)
MANRKYKKRIVGYKKLHREDPLTTKIYYRLVALRDIPEHGVKAGDIGGFIDGKAKLSQTGSCWIAENAMVSGHVTIEDDVYINGNATVTAIGNRATIAVKDHVKIGGDATVRQIAMAFEDRENLVISGKAQISGNTLMINVTRITGNAKIYGHTQIMHGVIIKDNVEICDHARVFGSQISGSSKISDRAAIGRNSQIHDTDISGVTVINGQVINNGNYPSEGILPAKSAPEIKGKFPEASMEPEAKGALFSFGEYAKNSQKMSAVKSQKNEDDDIIARETLEAYNNIMQELASYETDIVKIIKYPMMTDRTDPHTLAMILAANKAKRYINAPTGKHFKDAVFKLESAFLSAESNALKLASTKLDDSEQKRVQKAKDLLAIASNDASTEQEKKVSFEQAFKQLEGVIMIPEAAVETFRVKIGLTEIES